MKLLLISLSLLITPVFGQSGEDSLERMLEQMQKRFEKDHQEIEKMLSGDMFKRMQEMMKQMEGDDSIKQMRKMLNQSFGDFGNLSGFGGVEHEWIDKDNEKILFLKMEMDKEAPLDIKVEKGFIKVQGVYKKKTTFVDPDTGSRSESLSESHISESFQVPSGVDENKVRFEQVKGGIHVIFPRMRVDKTRTKVKPKKGDITL